MLDLILVIMESHCKYMENQHKACWAVTLQTASRDQLQDPTRSQANLWTIQQIKLKNYFLNVGVNLICGEWAIKLLNAEKDCLLILHVEISQNNLFSSAGNRNEMLKCQQIKPSHQQQFSVIFQTSEMRGKIPSTARSEEGHWSFLWPWLQHRP